MMLRQKRVDICLETIRAIAALPTVTEYIIGFTTLSAAQKGDQYRRVGFHHLIILADKMSRPVAIDLEHRIQHAIFKQGDSLSRNYHKEKFARGTLFKSSGDSPRDPAVKECSVYMAWWTRQTSS
jgi:hypothetical protein